MDILNWVYLLKNKLVKRTVQNPEQDLLVLGSKVTYAKRGDKYQSYGMTVQDFIGSGLIANTAHYELDITVTNVVTVNTIRGIIDIINTGSLFFPPLPAYASSIQGFINNPDLDLTAGNRDNIYIQYSVYYSQTIDDNVIPYLIATGVTPLGLGFDLYNANPAVAGANNWAGELYVYYELYTINN